KGRSRSAAGGTGDKGGEAPSSGRPRRGRGDAGASKPSADAAARSKSRDRSSSKSSAIEPYNEPLPFIEFVAAHPVGSTVTGTVERFASHGAYILADGTRCYLPLKHLADPPPRSAREVLSMG